MYQQTKKTAFGIIEMIVAMGIFLVLVMGGSIFLTQSFNINRLADQESQAVYYSVEGLEAVRSIAQSKLAQFGNRKYYLQWKSTKRCDSTSYNMDIYYCTTN
jgi:type II secretory pathway pseudopilin PulG